MTHAYGAVKFDNQIMYYEYDGTTDIARPKLYETHAEMIDHWREWNGKTTECNHVIEDVEIYTDYAGGFYWKGAACRKCNMIIKGQDTNDEDVIEIYGKPSWYGKIDRL